MKFKLLAAIIAILPLAAAPAFGQASGAEPKTKGIEKVPTGDTSTKCTINHSVYNSDTGKCDCEEGYSWNGGKTKCIAPSRRMERPKTGDN